MSISLYYHTIKNMKPSQVFWRVRKMLGLRCSLGVQPSAISRELRPIAALQELDFDTIFLERFPVEEFMAGKVTFLHETEQFNWNGKWDFPNRTPLWNYNLHYFEFIFPMVKAYKDTGEEGFFNQIKLCLNAWIDNNPLSAGGHGWAPYTISLRLTNWLFCYTALQEMFETDQPFHEKLISSIHAQFTFLSNHLEKDLLANHYFENLKALLLCSLFFGDDATEKAALKEFKEQCREQILPDGMHFELSPMYHKIILEDIMRVAIALRTAGKADQDVEVYIQPMLDVAFSLEEGLDRIPLFNDCGNNVAKSLDALVSAAKNHFDVSPVYKAQMSDSGYYIFKQKDWKLIVDAGQPGPLYNPGHAHCDAMSFELFYQGKPIIVNCGTFAYQCEERAFFRSTQAHNTVQREGVEQSQCWGNFRMAKAAVVKVIGLGENYIDMGMTDWKGSYLKRCINFDREYIEIQDKGSGALVSWIHSDDNQLVKWETNAVPKIITMPYSPEFGVKKELVSTMFSREGEIHIRILLNA